MTTTTQQRAPLHLPFVLTAVFGALGLALVAAMYLYGAGEHVQGFTGFFLTVFVGLTGFATSVYQLGKTDRQLEQITANTNGRLSAEQHKSAMLESQLLQAGITPVTAGAPPVAPTP